MLVFNTQHNCVKALGIEVKALGTIIKSVLVPFYLLLLSSPPSVYFLPLPSLHLPLCQTDSIKWHPQAIKTMSFQHNGHPNDTL